MSEFNALAFDTLWSETRQGETIVCFHFCESCVLCKSRKDSQRWKNSRLMNVNLHHLYTGVEERGYWGGQDLILITLDRHACFSVFHHLQKDRQRKQRHSLKLGKKRQESSKRNYYIISPRVIIKAIIIITNVRMTKSLERTYLQLHHKSWPVKITMQLTPVHCLLRRVEELRLHYLRNVAGLCLSWIRTKKLLDLKAKKPRRRRTKTTRWIQTTLRTTRMRMMMTIKCMGLIVS